MENHVEALERRICELSRENSGHFRTKLKLQERLEFIMQERDVWRRNAQTLKNMYAKIGELTCLYRFCFPRRHNKTSFNKK